MREPARERIVGVEGEVGVCPVDDNDPSREVQGIEGVVIPQPPISSLRVRAQPAGVDAVWIRGDGGIGPKAGVVNKGHGWLRRVELHARCRQRCLAGLEASHIGSQVAGKGGHGSAVREAVCRGEGPAERDLRVRQVISAGGALVRLHHNGHRAAALKIDAPVSHPQGNRSVDRHRNALLRR